MADWLIRSGASLDPVPWRNGLGTTRDVITVPHPDGALRWQVSIAELVQDAPFSHFPHCDRVFTPIAGNPPPELAFAGGPFEPCPLLAPRRFSGEVPTLSRIPAPGRAFNAIADRRYHTIDVRVLRPAPGEHIDLPAAPAVLFCHSGAVDLGNGRLAPGDSAVGPGQSATADGEATTVILVSIGPAVAPLLHEG